MQSLIDGVGRLADLWPFFLAMFAAAVVLWTADWFLFRRPVSGFLESRLVRQILMLALSVALLTVIVFTLPLDETAREVLPELIGLLFTVVFAFSSTSFVSNAMAGLMLRAVRNFSPGDFVRVGEHFGRVTERGLFHTEIQTEDRDLTTLPNLHLVSNPVKVVRSSGTIVSTEVSLGYDVLHQRVEPLFVAATETIGLEGGYVQVRELRDHAVVYRVAGFLRDVTELLSTSSRLRASIIDHLHGAGIEIASPALMTHRSLPADTAIIPEMAAQAGADDGARSSAETLAFDKAEHAAQIAKLRGELSAIDEQIRTLEQGIKKAPRKIADDESAGQRELDRLVAQRARTAEMIQELDENGSD